ncbi:TPA: hypothetical protein DEG21_05890 [Patescibacteria group bacterium]|nr:hypothetical protein [Candidatus Gracilibacteria bacterium]HBY75340.1 hypothetical protein [Candidatus Gracilibacteria bacterium]
MILFFRFKSFSSFCEIISKDLQTFQMASQASSIAISKTLKTFLFFRDTLNKFSQASISFLIFSLKFFKFLFFV